MTGASSNSAKVKSIINALKKTGDANLENLGQFLFNDAVEEDLSHYGDVQLVELVRGTAAFIQVRKPGRPLIRVSRQSGDGEPVTVIDVINDDMPFLVDSLLALLAERGHDIRLVLHPVILTKRDNKGALCEIAEERSDGDSYVQESLIHVHIDLQADDAVLAELEQAIRDVLSDIRMAVLDWRSMQQRVAKAMNDYQTNPPPVSVEELTEALAFLQWLRDNHFTFLGVREYIFDGGAATGELEPVDDSGLGILRNPQAQVLKRGDDMVTLTPAIRDFMMQPAPLIITKSDTLAQVHRRVVMDYVGIKQFDPEGELIGEVRVVGLFTATAYTRSPREVPMIRRKIANVLDKSGLSGESHSGKSLLNVLETFPRDELFQTGEEELATIAQGIMRLDERPRTRLFIRHDRFDRFVSAFVYISRDRFSSEIRRQVGERLAQVYNGRITSFVPSFREGTLVRVHFIIKRNEGVIAAPDITALENEIVEMIRTWGDRLADIVRREFPVGKAGVIEKRYHGAFPAGYSEMFTPRASLYDIREIEELGEDDQIGGVFYVARVDDPEECRLKLYHFDDAIPLSSRIPILENMGLLAVEESTFTAMPHVEGGRRKVFIHEMVMRKADGTAVTDFDQRAPGLEDCFMAVWNRQAENDGFNALVLGAGFSWREAALLRSFAKYLRQAGIAYSTDYMAQTMVRHPHIARKLVDLFFLRFDLKRLTAKGQPLSKQARKPDVRNLAREISADLNAVSSLDEDLIVRRMLNLVRSINRTNYFQLLADGSMSAAISFKIESRDIEGLPEPHPFAEIFVYSPEVEGVHLRGGKIARGGLRWSDRAEDFRTEVLGLAKAQNVKNAVIVPVGAKGGFVPKNLPEGGSREEIFAEGTRAYKLFVSSLLQISDNLDGDKIVPPENVLRNDDDDPYLVVAADKGTATFSDTANEISQAHGFWLDDAFASGGSAGYDHKKMGITARGGWEAVKRHFREIDIDIQTTPFTVIGVGDMSGDVFGNGMLLSQHIKLLAAFDHRDIFIDPKPDTAKSFAERKRIFDLPRSSWKDYNEKLISTGGGIFSRQLKAIPLSKEIQKLTGLKGKTATPNELMQAILKMQADLLWFGGIGTYVRATSESNVDAGDRANDAIRVTAMELKAKVIGEGANLGITHRARMEFSCKGGRINTDAVDNSAGVNSSDLEVNIKIALGAAETAGKLKRPERNKLLASMTEEVGQLCLRNNYLQTLCLSMSEGRGASDVGHMKRLIQGLEKYGLLNRRLEFLPEDSELRERESSGKGLCRPELSVLMAYAKILLCDALLESDVPDDPYFEQLLFTYFPRGMRKKYYDEIAGHKLRREIIATQLSNSVINRGGPAFVSRLLEETGHDRATIVRAFAVTRDAFGLMDLNRKIDELDNKISGTEQNGLYIELQRLLRRSTIWFLRNENLRGGVAELTKYYREGIESLSQCLDAVLPEKASLALAKRVEEYEARKIPTDVANILAGLRYLQRGPDIVLIAKRSKMPIEQMAQVFFQCGAELGIDRLIGLASQVQASGYYDQMAVNRNIDSLIQTHRSIVLGIVTNSDTKARDWDSWADSHSHDLTRVKASLTDLTRDRDFGLAKLSVAASQLADLVS